MRAGWFAVREMGLVVAILVAVFGLQYLCVNSAGPQTSLKGLGEQPVYQISLDQTGRRLWVHRPYYGITRKNLLTSRVEQSLAVPNVDMAVLAHSGDGLTSLWCSCHGMIVLARDNYDMIVAQVSLMGGAIVDAAVSQDGATALCVTSHGKIHGWSNGSREIAYQLPVSSPVIYLQLNRSGSQLCLVQFDGTCSFHCPETGIENGNRLKVGCPCHTAYWSEDEQLIGVVANGAIRTYATSTGETSFTSPIAGGSSMQPTCVMISPDSRLLAITTNLSPDISLWNLETGTSVGWLRGHAGIVRSLQFSRESDRLFTAGYDGTIREWSLASRTQLREID